MPPKPPDRKVEERIWNLIYLALCKHNIFDNVGTRLFNQLVRENEDIPFNAKELKKFFHSSMVDSLDKCDLAGRRMLRLYQKLEIEMSDSVKMALEKRFYCRISLNSDGLVEDFALIQDEEGPEAPTTSKKVSDAEKDVPNASEARKKVSDAPERGKPTPTTPESPTKAPGGQKAFKKVPGAYETPEKTPEVPTTSEARFKVPNAPETIKMAVYDSKGRKKIPATAEDPRKVPEASTASKTVPSTSEARFEVPESPASSKTAPDAPKTIQMAVYDSKGRKKIPATAEDPKKAPEASKAPETSPEAKFKVPNGLDARSKSPEPPRTSKTAPESPEDRLSRILASLQINKTLNAQIWKYISRNSNSLTGQMITDELFWQQMPSALAPIISPYLLLLHFKNNLLEDLWKQSMSPTMKLRILKDLKIPMTADQKKHFHENHNIDVKTSDEGVVTSWSILETETPLRRGIATWDPPDSDFLRKFGRSRGKSVEKGKGTSSSDDLHGNPMEKGPNGRKKSSEAPATSQKAPEASRITPTAPAAPEASEALQNAPETSRITSTAPEVKLKVPEAPKNAPESSTASKKTPDAPEDMEMDEYDSKGRIKDPQAENAIKKRTPFTIQEDVSAWNFIYKKLKSQEARKHELRKKGKEKENGPKGIVLWEEYIKFSGSKKTATGWNSHYRKRMINDLHLIPLPAEKMMYLYEKADVPITYGIRNQLEKKFHARIIIAEDRLVLYEMLPKLRAIPSPKNQPEKSAAKVVEKDKEDSDSDIEILEVRKSPLNSKENRKRGGDEEEPERAPAKRTSTRSLKTPESIPDVSAAIPSDSPVDEEIPQPTASGEAPEGPTSSAAASEASSAKFKVPDGPKSPADAVVVTSPTPEATSSDDVTGDKPEAPEEANVVKPSSEASPSNQNHRHIKNEPSASMEASPNPQLPKNRKIKRESSAEVSGFMSTAFKWFINAEDPENEEATIY